MASFTLLSRLSSVEGDTSYLQSSLDVLSRDKQNNITNTTVSEGQALLDSENSTLNKIGIKDDTLLIETSNKVIKLRVDKGKTQEKLIAITDATNATTTSKAVLSNTTLRSIGVDIVVTDEVSTMNFERFVLCGRAHTRKLEKRVHLHFYSAGCPMTRNLSYLARKLKRDAR